MIFRFTCCVVLCGSLLISSSWAVSYLSLSLLKSEVVHLSHLCNLCLYFNLSNYFFLTLLKIIYNIKTIFLFCFRSS